MANVYLSLNPANLPATVPMNVGDNLYITVAASCKWCWSDPTSAFPAQGTSNCLPALGSYTLRNPPQVFAVAIPTAAGTVYFNAVATNSTCDCSPQCGHTIKVG